MGALSVPGSGVSGGGAVRAGSAGVSGGMSGAAGLEELLEFHSPSAALAVAPVRGPARGVTWAVCGLAAACAAAASLIPVDRVVTAQGRVVAVHPTAVVQPLETAIVRAIHVREGQVVRRGEALAQLDPTFASADLGALAAQVASLDAEVARLEAEAAGAPYRAPDAGPSAALQGALFQSREAERGFKRESLRRRIEAVQEQVRRAMADAQAYGERLRVAAELESKRAELERLQVGSQLNRLSATDNRIEVQRGLDGARAQAAQAARELQALQAEAEGYERQWRAQVGQELSEASRKLSDAREQLAKARLRRQLVELRAEADSVVLSVARVSPGSVLQSGEQFLTLVPLDAPLEVEANVAGSDAGFVREGNPATVKFDTFPFTQYGTAEGRVRVVSPDSFTPEQEAQSRGGRGVGSGSAPPGSQSYYRARVTLEHLGLHDVPSGFRLVPGMPVTADIKVGERTVMGYLLGRVLPVALEGMREP